MRGRVGRFGQHETWAKQASEPEKVAGVSEAGRFRLRAQWQDNRDVLTGRHADDGGKRGIRGRIAPRFGELNADDGPRRGRREWPHQIGVGGLWSRPAPDLLAASLVDADDQGAVRLG